MAGRSFASLLADQPAAAGTVTPEQLNLTQLEQQHGLPSGLLSAVMQQESGGRVRAVSPAGAQGPFQFMPGTAQQYGIDPFDPQQSAQGAARMYADLSKKYGGDLPKMLAGYNWGQGNVDRKGLENAPEETRNYINSIMGRLQAAAIEPVQEAPARQALAQAQGRSFAGLLADQPSAPAQPAAPAAEPGFLERTRELGRRIDAGLPLEEGGPQPQQAGAAGTYGQRFFRGMTAPIRGLEQMASYLIPDPIERAMTGAAGMGEKTFSQVLSDEEAQQQEMLRNQGFSGFDWAGMAGNIVSPPNIALAGARLPAAVAAKLPAAAQWGARLAVPAAAEAVVQPVYRKDGGEMTAAEFAGEKAQQAGLGAAAGMVGGAVAKGLTAAAGKAAGILSGKVQPEAEELMRLGREWNVPLTAANIDEPRRSFMRRAQQMIERVPVGLDAQQQRQAAVQAATGYADQALESMRKIPYTNLADVQKIAESGGKRAKEAQAVLRLVEEAGEDWKKIVRASGNLKGLRMKLSSDKLYDELSQAMGRMKQVQPVRLTDTLNRLISTEDKLLRGNRSLVNQLQRYQMRLDSEDFVPTWDNLRDLRTALNNEVESLTKPGVKEPPGFVDAYRSMIDAITADLDTFAKRHPNTEVRDLWKRADAFYKKNVAPFKERELASTLRDVDTDHIYARFVANDDAVHQLRMWKALDEKGRAAVRYGMIEEQVAKAYNQSLNTIDPVKLASSLQRMSNASSTYFKGQSKQQLDGFIKLFGHLRHMTEPEGGQFGYTIGYGGGLAALFGLTGTPGAVGGIGTAIGLKQLLTTERGLKILFAANLAKQGSKRMTELADEAVKLATEASAEVAGAQAGRQAPNVLEGAERAGAVFGGQAAGRAVGGEPEDQRRQQR